ncbi:hypothetical protein [Virgibacillus ihumii]|uniref:hypothetical protein n=1 Tax=Virgibacillus ihumii TaxID=2686091 RepID=UPI00157DA5A4|nr:hypothetical protein [Virgibacillus ihumii]
MIDLYYKEKEILAGLKDFQRATVERVHQLFTTNYSRVLVADEVGLGKTMVAKGVMAKTARYHQEQNDNLFKVVYVCSNQNIASQNLSKLRIDHRVTLDGLSDTRLSMQHLKIFEDEYSQAVQENYIQLIPLTPSTSFKMTQGCGSVRERALIFAILKRHEFFEPYVKELEIMMTDSAYKGWAVWNEEYDKRVRECDEKSAGAYLETMQTKIDQFFSENPGFQQEFSDVCDIFKKQGDPGKRVEGQTQVIQRLRKMMAEASVDLIDADLVIMDEFQRFPELINAARESETAMLASKFFNKPKIDNSQVKILLLSATPYKPYSTLEEISESGTDEHYKEFMQVTDFLFEKHPQHKQEFRRVWGDYSTSLSEVSTQDFAMILAKKQVAEDSLYKGIARTERVLEEGNSDVNNESIDKTTLQITEDDVASFIEMDKLLQRVGLKDSVPVEYVKSAPFLMSFMDHYKLKDKIMNEVSRNPVNNASLKNPLLWVNRKTIGKYGTLRETNARMKKLKEIALADSAERLMWIPPSLPYYEFEGCYKGMSSFSKVLVFSGWEMVPRSIATLLSYEAERKTVGELVRRTPKKKRSKAYNYFAEQRYPRPRLNFRIKNNAPANMNHLTLLYPSVTLAKLFDPVDILNRGLSLEAIKAETKDKLAGLLDGLSYESNADETRRDERWYYMAPLLFDLDETVVQNWFEQENLLAVDDKDGERDEEDLAGIAQHFEELREMYYQGSLPVLGRQPDDLLDVLTAMVLGSPAICSLRLMENVQSENLPYAIKLGKTIIDRFNIQEMISIVELEYSKDAHWKGVLKYCVDGNFQAMLDEYAHMLLEESGLNRMESGQRNERLMNVMTSALKSHSASLNVDTYQSFQKRASGESGKDDTSIKMRTNFAVGFYDKRNADKSKNRKDNVRLAFNSPFRPFVLATTSIGQEGLDFHYYCRKIMHWNLPSNPIDLEQRDGRINRYKCHAIRQNIANRYGNISFDKEIWNEMFTLANEVERDDNTSELVPFWSLPGKDGKGIERIFPLYPLSRDGAKYRRLMKVLTLYRLSLGQARQGDLLDQLLSAGIEEEQLKGLFMNLSPFAKEKEPGEIRV